LLRADLPIGQGTKRVADVGAGTGKLTLALAADGLDVDAIEPDPGMRAVLVARAPTVRVHAGRGEALPLPDSSVDAVVYGNAWHWVDGAAGAREAARVLRPDGILAMLWNYEDESMSWVSELAELIGSSSRNLASPPVLQQFSPAQIRQTSWVREQDVAALADYALSHSGVAVLPDRRRAEVLAAVRRLATEHPDLRGRTRVEVPMHLLYWSYRRASPTG
jgi:SAM-dependent methyltransferase